MRLIIAILVAAASIALVTQVSAGEKVTVCHATGSESNPFVEVTIARQAWESGHSPHAVHVGDYLGSCTPISTPTLTGPSPTLPPSPSHSLDFQSLLTNVTLRAER